MAQKPSNTSDKKALEQLFNQALHLHQASHLQEAKRLYEKILKKEPKHADSLHLLGLIYQALGQEDDAIGLIRRAIQCKPHPTYFNHLGNLLQHKKHFDEAIEAYKNVIALDSKSTNAYYNLGVAFQVQGNLERAIEAYRNVITLNPTATNAYYNLGVALFAQGHLDEAIQAYTKVVELNPNSIDAYNNLGVLLKMQGKMDEAISVYTKIIEVAPTYADAYNNLGNALYDQGKYDNAIEAFLKALHLKPEYPEAYYNLGNVLRVQGKIEASIEAFQKALTFNPNYAKAANNLGVILKTQGKVDEAIDLYRKAIALSPNDPEAYNNLGAALKAKNQIEEAILLYKKALLLNPKYVDAHNNLGNALQDQGKLEEAMEAFRHALALDPTHADASLNYALALLLSGDLLEGFKRFEERWRVASGRKAKRAFTQPLWLGETSLQGKSILIHSEQGFGDTLQFCRYLECLSDHGARVIFEVDKPLKRLFEHFSGASTVIERGASCEAFDYHCPLLSLPMALKTTLQSIPSKNPYIMLKDELSEPWRHRLGKKSAPRVGLVWNGGFRADQPELWPVNQRRNIPFELIAKLNRQEIDFYSLQKGELAEEALKQCLPTLWKTDNFFNLMDEVGDFADTAGFIEQLDLVISVDTSTAHLAAAMGKPVWLLNRFDTCWRWMQHTDVTPWYPTLRLFRQTSLGDWDGVIVRVQAALEAWLSLFPKPL